MARSTLGEIALLGVLAVGCHASSGAGGASPSVFGVEPTSGLPGTETTCACAGTERLPTLSERKAAADANWGGFVERVCEGPVRSCKQATFYVRGMHFTGETLRDAGSGSPNQP